MLGDLLAEFHLIRGHVQERDFALGKGVGHAADDGVAELAFDIGDVVLFLGAAELGVEGARIGDMPGIDAVRAQPDHAEVLVADGDRRGGAPALVGLDAAGEEIDVALERRLEHLVPVHEVGEERQRLGVEGVQTRPEDVGHLAFVDESGHLRFADGKLGAVLDFHVLHGVAPGENAVAGLRPVDDVYKLLLQEITKSHGVLGFLRSHTV